MQQDNNLDVVASLTQENARLRALLLAMTNMAQVNATSTIDEESDPIVLATELAASKIAQTDLAREVASLRASQRALVCSSMEGQASEVVALRSSLAKIAAELETEKTRADEVESKLQHEQEKTSTLRNKIEDSRRSFSGLQAGPASLRRTSVESAAPALISGPRRSSFLDSTPRRRSSLGLCAPSSGLAESTQSSNPGLGFAVDGPGSNSALSTSPSPNRPLGLQLLAARRGSNLSINSNSNGLSREEEERLTRFRDLRHGLTSTKIASRRSSLVTGVPDFLAPGEFELDLERRRMSLRTRHGSIADEGLLYPPPAPLRVNGRKQSVAVFESWSRRSSSASSNLDFGYYLPPYLSASDAELNQDLDTTDVDELRLHLQGLRIQLAEAEEGRRASELCVQALRSFITKQSNASESILEEFSLPAKGKDSPQAQSARNSLTKTETGSFPRLSLNEGRRSLPGSDAEKDDMTRRPSAASDCSTSTFLDRQKLINSFPTRPVSSRSVSAPLFSGSFSFSAEAPTSSLLDLDTSPTMGAYSPSSDSSPGFYYDESAIVDEEEEEETVEKRIPRPRLQRSPESSAPSLSSGASETSDEDESRSASPDTESPRPCQIAASDSLMTVLDESNMFDGGLFGSKGSLSSQNASAIVA